MEYLQEEIRKNGFVYQFYKRGDKCMIYKQLDPSDDMKLISYEIFKIKVDKPKEVFGIKLGLREKFPGNEDFGKWAWSISGHDSLERVSRRFDLIESGKDDSEE